MVGSRPQTTLNARACDAAVLRPRTLTHPRQSQGRHSQGPTLTPANHLFSSGKIGPSRGIITPVTILPAGSFLLRCRLPDAPASRLRHNCGRRIP
jgi:hypothetical protein